LQLWQRSQNFVKADYSDSQLLLEDAM